MTDQFLTRYQHKLKTREEIVEILGPFPREAKAIMCHGVFDVVHPGHVRHLVYAKGVGDILVASITSDQHVTKGQYRPHIPEKLRALNLAAFEVVDFVVIDENPTPIENLRVIQPDFFAKGFEYVNGKLPPKTQEELDTITAYGGEMIFTPGDYVYSSSNLITMAEPDVMIEKLLMLMQEHDITFDSLRAVLDKLSGFRVHVVGDTIVDTYTRTKLIGSQGKTPTFSVLFQTKEDYIGGAAIVAHHLRAAGADVVFSTVLGEDTLKDFVLERLEAQGIDCRAITDATRPTTNKNVIIADSYRMLKVDTLDNRSISESILDRLCDEVRSVECDAVVFSDFRHGIYNKRTIPQLTAAIPEKVFRVADSQVASRWGNITEFQGFDLITPNEREARFALADQDSTVGRLGGSLLTRARADCLFLKLGERGLFCVKSSDEARNGETADRFSIGSFTKNVVDAVGAGDALLAYSTLALLASGNEAVAAIIGSMAAALECERDGNIPVGVNDLATKIDTVERDANYQ